MSQFIPMYEADDYVMDDDYLFEPSVVTESDDGGSIRTDADDHDQGQDQDLDTDQDRDWDRDQDDYTVHSGGFDWRDIAPGEGRTPRNIHMASSSHNSTPVEASGTSSQGSSMSPDQLNERRRSRTGSILNVYLLEAAKETQCGCPNRSCTSKFDVKDIFGLRHARIGLNHAEDMARRNADLKAAAEKDQRRCLIAVEGKTVCLMAYCILFDINWSSMRRSWARLTNGGNPPAIGRPNAATDGIMGSARSIQAYAWIKTWLEVFGDEHPVGQQYKYVVNYVLASDLYEEYSREFYADQISITSAPLSLRSFSRIWTLFQKQEKVRVRRKANTTTKCKVCDDLHERATGPKATRADLAEVRKKRIAHHKEILELRQLYVTDTQRAKHDFTFQTIAFDGTNSNSCNCPQSWRSSVRGERPEGTFVPQKIQSVLIHGRALIFYVVPPCVEQGMDLTVSCLVDAMQYVDPRTRIIRFQYDGESSSPLGGGEERGWGRGWRGGEGRRGKKGKGGKGERGGGGGGEG